MKNRLGTILGVIVAVVIAWFLVDIGFKLMWLLWKIVVVAVVAGVVWLALQALTRRRS